MLELGPAGPGLHEQSGARMKAAGVDILVGVRGLARNLVSAFGESSLFLETPAEAGIWLAANLREGDAVLLKASRGVRLEAALDKLLT
jgi:UDP-N-acetylmuramoyl-tripeptide--D-alanyl-D-alanine ligase